MLLHDNMRPHVGGLTQSMLTTLKFEVLAHPVYSLNLSLCDYEVFGSLKKCLDGKLLFTNKEANEEML